MKTMLLVWISFFSNEYKMDPVLVEAIVRTESSYNSQAIGPIGEIGLMQMRHEYLDNPKKYLDPYENLKEGVKRLAELKRLENELGPFWYTAWNLGPTGAKRYNNKKGLYKHPYSKKVLANYIKIKKEIKTRPLSMQYQYMATTRGRNFPLVVQAE